MKARERQVIDTTNKPEDAARMDRTDYKRRTSKTGCEGFIDE
jgi:hypothetical protein